MPLHELCYDGENLLWMLLWRQRIQLVRVRGDVVDFRWVMTVEILLRAHLADVPEPENEGCRKLGTSGQQ